MYNDLNKKAEKDFMSGGANKLNNALSVKTQVNPAETNVNALQLQDETKRLRLLVQQRDNEIMILLNMINKNKAQAGIITLFILIIESLNAN